MNFGEKIKVLRNKKGYTQLELAERSGITLRSVQRIENNEVKPSLHSLKVLGKALEVDFSEFRHLMDEKPDEFEFKIKITDMNQLVNDFKILIRNNWKILLIITLIVIFISNYNEIKSGLIDGWNSK